MYVNISQIDDFLESVKHDYILTRWSDISMPLQKFYFASRLFNKAAPERNDGRPRDVEGPSRQQRQLPIHRTVRPGRVERGDLLTHAQIGWSFGKSNYIYDVREKYFNQGPVQIIKYMRTLEHSMYNSYFKGMELAMFGNGPTSVNQQKPPPCSLTWWIQPYTSSNTGSFALPSGTTSGFYGINPAGFSNTASIDRTTYQNVAQTASAPIRASTRTTLLTP